jgi:hypothetical protein
MCKKTETCFRSIKIELAAHLDKSFVDKIKLRYHLHSFCLVHGMNTVLLHYNMELIH